jgi:hypothetical protein
VKRLLLAAILCLAIGCGAYQPTSATNPNATNPTASSAAAAPANTPNNGIEASAANGLAQTSPGAAKKLPFAGRLVSGDRSRLPPAVAASLSDTSPIEFSYREELTHDDYQLPLWFTAIDPVTYLGSPLGDYGASAFASLSITHGDRVLGDYTARVHVSKSYNLYSAPTHKQVDDEARAAVRDKIDQQLYRDASRIAGEIAGGAPAPIERTE